MGRRPDRFREGGRHLPLGDAGFVVMREDDGVGRLFLRFFFPCCMIGKGTGHRRPIRTEIHMNSKYFSINEGGYSIRCKLYGTGAREYGRMVVYGHGFGGHKDTKAAERLAEKLLSKKKDVALVTFDLPGHGEDAMRELHLSDCDAYLDLVIRHLREKFGAKELYANATSFGGYVFLDHIRQHENPFRSVVLRCPAVEMLKVFTGLITEDHQRELSKGRPAMVGFDRKVRVTADYLRELEEHDLLTFDYSGLADSMLILQGTKDEIVPCEMVTSFADRNGLLCMTIEGADHRFQDPKKMDEAIKETLEFFDL